jgi:8-oxo-dGDP phosphatase
MVQEAKASCRGKWYLPAGRMERNESIVDAVKREVVPAGR